MGTIAIRAPRRAELAEGAGLLAAALGFADRDAIPAWLMAVTDGCGGLTLVAVDGDRVAGISYAFPDLGGERRGLYSCGLAVRPEYRRLGLARSLKLEQRRRARRAGYASIRWTADPRNAAALSLYLRGLGARLVGYHAGLHDGLRAPTGAPDDVEIVWPLGAHSVPDGATRWVELGELAHVRARMRELLGAGYVGVDVDRRELPRVGFRRPVAA